jgi:hypothetical protein
MTWHALRQSAWRLVTAGEAKVAMTRVGNRDWGADCGLCYAAGVSDKELAEREARAARRRSSWHGGVTKLSEMESVNEGFWGAMLPEQRFLAVWDLSREQYGSRADAASRLRGSPYGVRHRNSVHR